MKKILSFALAAIMIFTVCLKYVSCGNSVTFIFEKLNNGTYAVSLRRPVSEKGRVEIPAEHRGKEVTAIKFDGFKKATGVEEVIFPDTMVYIGAGAFDGCSGLTKIELPDSVRGIGDFAFNFCKNLEEFTFPKGVEKVSSGIFSNCFGLEKVTIPDTVKTIKEFAFMRCSSLKDVYYDGTIEMWGKIEKEKDFAREAYEFTVHCTDGDVKGK